MEPTPSAAPRAGDFWTNHDDIQTEFDNRSQLQTWETFFNTAHGNFDGQSGFMKDVVKRLERQALSGFLAAVLVGSLEDGIDSLAPFVTPLAGVNKKNSNNPFHLAYETLVMNHTFADIAANAVKPGTQPDQGAVGKMKDWHNEVQDAFDAVAVYLGKLPQSASWKGPGGRASLAAGEQMGSLKVIPSQLKKFVNGFSVDAQKTLPVDNLDDASKDRPLSAGAFSVAVSSARAARDMQDLVNANFEQISNAMSQMGKGTIDADDAGYRALVALLERSAKPSHGPFVNNAADWLRAQNLPRVADVVESADPIARKATNFADSVGNWFGSEFESGRKSVSDVINNVEQSIHDGAQSPDTPDLIKRALKAIDPKAASGGQDPP